MPTKDQSFAELLHGGPVTLAEVDRVRDTLVFDGPMVWPKLLKFLILLVLASCIATYGLLGDSVAVVIGAMIVAPLMLPIMGLAFSISVGDRRAIRSTLSVSLLGVAMAVAMGFLLTLPIAQVVKPEAIQQIMIRTAPHLLDLMAALMTGLAGAFALARKDVSDTLPGVAIAVSLVPPLANAGILFALGEGALASGSLLLFVTNYVAILLTGSLVFAAMGFRQAALSPFDARARRRALTVALVALVIIAVPLTMTSTRLIISRKIAVRTDALVQSWVEGSGYRLLSIDAETADGSVNLVLMGEGDLPSLDSLQERARGILLGRRLHLKVVESRSLSLAADPG